MNWIKAVSSGLLAVAFWSGCITAETGKSPIEIAYIANEGFLIRSGGKALLVDALFRDATIDYCDVPSQELLESMVASEGLFRDIDLVLVTHAHRDHFDAGSVAGHLMANPRAVLICPRQAADSLKESCSDYDEIAGRILSMELGIDESASIDVSGIHLRVFRMKHSPYMVVDEATGERYNRHEEVENLVYLVDLGGRRFLHVGDATLKVNRDLLESLRLEKEGIDVAILEFFDRSSETAQILSEHIKPRHIIFMHLPRDRELRGRIRAALEQDVPGAVMFEEPMESRTF